MPYKKDANRVEIGSHERRAKQIMRSLGNAADSAKALHGHLTKLNGQAEKMATALGKSKAVTDEHGQALHSLLESVHAHVRAMASSEPLEGKQLREHRAEVKKTLPHLRSAMRTTMDLHRHLQNVTANTSKI
jgi:hypothetical protein